MSLLTVSLVAWALLLCTIICFGIALGEAYIWCYYRFTKKGEEQQISHRLLRIKSNYGKPLKPFLLGACSFMLFSWFMLNYY